MKNQRKDGRLQKWVTIGKKDDGAPMRRIVYADTAEELEQKVQHLKKDAALGKVGTTIPAFSVVAEEWLKSIAESRSKSTQNGYRTYLNRCILPAIGNKLVTKVTDQDIKMILDKMQTQGYSQTSLLQTKSIAQRIVKYAQKNGFKMCSEWSRISLKEEQKKREEQRTLTDDELSLILSKQEGHRMCTSVLIMLFCGLTGTEIRALEWADIDLRHRIIRVDKSLINTKFAPELQLQKKRQIPISDELATHLQKLPKASGLICPNNSSTFMTNQQFQTAWVSYCRFLHRKYPSHTNKHMEHLALQDFFTAQNVRLTYAKMLFQTNLNILEIQYLLGLTSFEAVYKLGVRFLRVDEERIQEHTKNLYLITTE